MRTARYVLALSIALVGAGTDRARAQGETCDTATIIPWSVILQPGGYFDNGFIGTLTENNSPISCAIDDADVFYTFTPDSSTLVDITTCSPTATIDTALAIKRGPCTSLVNQACNDDDCCFSQTHSSTLRAVPLTAGQVYVVQVESWSRSNTDPFELRIAPAGMLPRYPPDLNAFSVSQPLNPIASGITSPYRQVALSDPLVFYQVTPANCLDPPLVLKAIKAGSPPDEIDFYF